MHAPADAQCAYHPGTPAPAICGRCGSFLCAACTTTTDQGIRCARCTPTYVPRGTRSARFLANLVDTTVVTLPAVVPFMAFLFISASSPERGGGEDAALAWMLGGGTLGFLVGLGIQLAMQLRFGQSVGKRLFKLKVVRSDGSDVELWRIVLLRNLALQAAAQLCGLVGIVDVVMIFNADMRCLHDVIADTVVIDVSDQPGA